MSLIGDNLTFLRKHNKLTQAEISHRLSIPITTYASYEYGKAEPDTETLLKLSEILNVELLVILTKNLSEGNLNKNQKEGKNRLKGNPNGNPNGNLYAQKAPVAHYLNEPSGQYKTACKECKTKDQLIESQAATIKALQSALSHAESQLNTVKKKGK